MPRLLAEGKESVLSPGGWFLGSFYRLFRCFTTCHGQGELGGQRRVHVGLRVPLQRLHFQGEALQIRKVAVHAGKAHVGDVIEGS